MTNMGCMSSLDLGWNLEYTYSTLSLEYFSDLKSKNIVDREDTTTKLWKLS